MHMNTDSWYRLLNLGLRLAAGAGSATGVKQVPAGFNRTYVRVDPDTSLKEFNETWKLGRNFVTNGPVILLRGPDEQLPGDEIEVTTAPRQIEFSLTVLSDQPLQHVELVQNGAMVERFAGNNQKQLGHRVRVEVTESCWIAARCTARDDLLSDRELQQYDNPPRQLPSRLRFAHTSPIYVVVNGKPVVIKQSVQEGLLMLDRLQKFADEHAAPDVRDDFSNAIRRAHDMLKASLRLLAT